MSVKEALLLILDIGFSASQKEYEDGTTFLDKAKKCIERIIKRKIFACAGDEIGLVLLGTEESANSLGYLNISEGFRLANPSWQMLKVLEDVKGTSVKNCDWIDALVVAMDTLQTQTGGKKFSGKKIVMLVNPDNNASDDKLDTIISGIESLEIELTVLGVDLFPQNFQDNESMQDDLHLKEEEESKEDTIPDISGKSQKERSEILLKHIISKIGGISCNFQDALSQLKNFQQKPVRPTPWNVLLDIGPDIRIPVSAFKKISDPPPNTWKKALVDSSKQPEDNIKTSSNETTEVPLDKERLYMRDDQSTVAEDSLIAGYFFGSSAVPFNEFDHAEMSYKPGGKCLSVLKFASQDDVTRRLFIGDAVYFILAQKQRPDAQEALSALITTLNEQRKVAIATKAYNKGCYPHLVALFPLIKKKFECLMMVELPFSEEVNEFVFPRLVPAKDEPNSDELAAVDSFIDSMDLMAVEKDCEVCEAFCLKDTYNPATIQEFQSIEHRILHPNDPLPPISDDIKDMFHNPFQSVSSYTHSLNTLKDKFRITEQPEMSSLKKKKRFKRDGNEVDVNGINDPQPSTSSDQGYANMLSTTDITVEEKALVEVGTAAPHEDFVKLLEQAQPFKSVCEQMQKVILNLVLKSFGFQNFPKALTAVKTLRTSCVEKDPSIYNEWLPNFKENLSERDKMMFWKSLVEDGLGLISLEENNASTVTREAAANFLEIKEDEGDEQEGADDLFDEM